MRNALIELARLKDQLRTHGLKLTLLAAYDKLRRAFKRTPSRRFTQITPQIILGGQPATRAVHRLIAKRGVTGFINMRSEYDYARKFRHGDTRYLHLPTPDNEAPSLDHLCKGVDFIREEVGKGGAVYIHCWEGLGRGPTMAAAYLVSTGMDVTTALEQIRQVRPFIRPTERQLQRLAEFERHYGQPGAPTDQPPIVESEATWPNL
ncbi:MAG: dual specificity protein phosphatase family protein [Anaerolineae bacterium]|jgi:predicted protein tyrosine phosphatase|nr:dual specificity protein phosphatase family protein [Anaerolineae bacterium]